MLAERAASAAKDVQPAGVHEGGGAAPRFWGDALAQHWCHVDVEPPWVVRLTVFGQDAVIGDVQRHKCGLRMDRIRIGGNRYVQYPGYSIIALSVPELKLVLYCTGYPQFPWKAT